MSKPLELVRDAADSLITIIEDAWEDLKDVVDKIWDEIAMPILEEVFSWFGIKDENVYSVQKMSIKLLDPSTNVYKAALTRTVLSNIKNDATFYQNYVYEVSRNKAQIGAVYRQIRNGNHTHGLPDMTISGGSVDASQLSAELNAAIGAPVAMLDFSSHLPSTTEYFKNELQSAPELYKPYANTLTADNQYGESFDDWQLVSAVFNDTSSLYDINISRNAAQAVFWLEGVDKVTEGDSIEYRVMCNRPIPLGKTITVTLAYSGTATPSTDYTEVPSVDLPAGTQETVFFIVTNENAVAGSIKTLQVSIASVDNSDQVFQAIRINTPEASVTTSIVDDDTLMLTVPNIQVSESAMSVTVPVKLEGATTPFTVDYDLSNITAIKGVDYENTSGTLSFVGTSGEVQNIVIGITADLIDDDYEQFQVLFSNCSNALVDVTQTCVVTIVDQTDVKYPPTTTVESAVIAKADYVADRTLMVRYHHTSAPASEWFLWHYRYSSGTHPALTFTADRMSNLDVLPTVILRNDRTNVTDDKASKKYKSTRRLLNMMNLNLDDLMESILSNPDISAVEDVVLYFGMNPTDELHAISKMLYLMWEDVIVARGISSNSNKFYATYQVDSVIYNSVVWTHQHYEERPANERSPDVGKYSHRITGEVSILDVDVGPLFNDDSLFGASLGKVLILKHRPSVGVERIIRVKGLNTLSMISANINGQVHHKVAPHTLGDAEFTIPVSWFILNKLSPRDALEVFPHMMRLEFYAAVITELDWYQTDGFKDALQIVAVIITIVFWWAGSGTWAELLYQLAISYLVGEIVVLGIEVIYKLTGSKDLALAVGLIAAVFLASKGTLSIDFTDPVLLLEISTRFANNIALVYSMENKNIQNQIADLNTAFDQRQEEIDKANDSLSGDVSADYIAHLNSVDTNLDLAITAQYNYSNVYNYDSLVQNFHDDKLKVGVV